MKDKTKIFLFALGLVIPALLIFRAVFSASPLAWGDSVHFYKENFEELTSLPQAWVNRENNFGGINRVIWLYPLMLLLGFLGKIGLASEVVMRIIFYIPAITLSFLSAMYFAKGLGYSPKIRFFTSLVYSLNTYFLLLVDGGQSGVFLAYALFPLPLLYLKKLLEEGGGNNFALSFLFLTLLILSDPRVAVVCIITLFLWLILEALFLKKTPSLKNISNIILLLLIEALVSLYWLIPLFVFGEGQVSAHVSTLQLSSLLNGLLIYQPHWPQNIFGVVTFPPFYFVLVPALVLGGLLVKPAKKDFIFALIFLFFAFLTKGETPPLGGIYKFVIESVPFGISLRDSTKFFTPLLLFGGLLIGLFIEKVKSGLSILALYFYLLFLIYPALTGNLKGNLKLRSYSRDFAKISEKIRNESGSVRSLWFPERHALSFQTERTPALDAKDLLDLKPFAFFNEGTYDRFNFMNKKDYLEWFKLLGVKYLIFSGNPRLEKLSEEEKESWENLNALVATASGLTRVDWDITFPVYKLENIKPRVFAVDKVLLVVGPYLGLSQYLNDFGMIFLEDGKVTDPSFLKNIKEDSAVLVFNKKEEKDLQYAFLQKYFLGADESIRTEWAVYPSREFLDSKYQLLIRGLDLKDLDFDKGIAFSTQNGEKMEFSFEAPEDGQYYLSVRGVGGEGDPPLKAKIADIEFDLDFARNNLFDWQEGSIYLGKGKHTLILQNPSGLKVVNLVAIIPKKEAESADAFANELISRFKKYDLTKETIDEPGGWDERVEEGSNWLVFSDSFHPLWRVRGEKEITPLPFYSLVNGFYIGEGNGDFEIYFQGQEYFDKGIMLSAVSLLAVSIFILAAKRNV